MCYVFIMSSLFVFSNSLLNPKCKYNITSSYGMKQFSVELDSYDSICINISIFDYFIVFNHAPDDLRIYEYHSFLNGTDVSYYSDYFLDDISIYRHIKALFAFQMITSYKGGNVSFSYGSLPDICKTGIIFTNNHYLENIFLSGSQKPPYKIGVNDDLCIVSTVQAYQSFLINMQTEVCCDKLFVYKSMIPIDAFSGSVDGELNINATDEPVILRFVSDDQAEESKYVKITMGSDGDFPSKAGIVFYDPREEMQPNCPKDKCTFYKYFHIKTLIIIIISIIGVIIVFSAVFYITARCCCPHFIMFSVPPPKDQKNIWQENNRHVEDRAGPQGYFALDPILRPK